MGETFQRLVFGRTIVSALIALTALVALGVGPVVAEAYRLAAGDRLRAQFIGLGNETYVATVDGAGDIRLPYLGVHGAAGKTLDELTRDIALAIAGRQLRLVRDGVDTIVLLDEDDVFLDVETYRPVTVTGLVASPGRIPFEPGMSARTAIGSAGGASLLGDLDRADRLADWRTRQAELRETEAWLLADLWRITALLTDGSAETPPDAFAQRLAERLSAADLDMMRKRIANARDQIDRQRDDIDARMTLTRKRIEFLETALTQFQTASDIEEKRLQDVLNLSDRGLATANVLDNAREGALNASSRLLTTQADLAAAERDLQSLSLAKRGLAEEFEARLLEEQTRTERVLAETSARLSSLRQEMALGALAEDDQASAGVRVLLHRRVDGEEVSRDIAPSALLQPGDVIEVLLANE